MFNKPPLILTFKDLVADVLLIENQVEFVFLVFNVRQEDSSHVNTLSKFIFNLSDTESWVLPDTYTTVSSAYICRPMSDRLLMYKLKSTGPNSYFNFTWYRFYVVNCDTLFTALQVGLKPRQ